MDYHDLLFFIIIHCVQTSYSRIPLCAIIASRRDNTWIIAAERHKFDPKSPMCHYISATRIMAAVWCLDTNLWQRSRHWGHCIEEWECGSVWSSEWWSIEQLRCQPWQLVWCTPLPVQLRKATTLKSTGQSEQLELHSKKHRKSGNPITLILCCWSS